ncbi:putative membrane protein [Rhodopirellula maiorica SM1]|uniref:Putative membrane protein n=1 Tax=Rhodopirellula maiorica SM1 TaxID=1265738 RepID=M5RDW3_9BACT|nr:DUF2752 domain-containing protein [Rhodopirellula maiorica]EMI17575.1 putative membrane protein [Rhodopirellula maiorica SM1]
MNENRNSKPLLLIAIVAILVVCAATGIVLLQAIQPNHDSWFPKCQFYQVTGIHCPGCGATRAVLALLRGDVLLAVRNNALLILGGPLLVIYIVRQNRRPNFDPRSTLRIMSIMMTVLVLFFIARNIPTPSTSPFAPIPTAEPVPTSEPLPTATPGAE